MDINMMVLTYFDDIIKSAIKSVYNDINENTENFVKSFDILKKIRNTHLQNLEKSLSKIQIWGMSGPIPLSQIYVPTRLTRRVSRNYFVDLDRADSVANIRIQVHQVECNPYSFINDNKYILILGGPGSGKTTFLSSIILAYAGITNNIAQNLKQKLFPVWISLRNYPKLSIDLKSILLNELEQNESQNCWPFIERLLVKGSIVIALDGLDEIPLNSQTVWQTSIDKFRKRYPLCKIILSCRTSGLNVDFPDFQHAEILPFDQQDHLIFIDSWFRCGKPSIPQKLKAALKASPRLADLTGTPLLLSLICILFEHDLELPRHRTDLYSRCIEAMLLKWDTSRGFRRDTAFAQLSINNRRRIFQRVGAEFTKNERSVLPAAKMANVVGDYICKFDIEEGSGNEVLQELESHHGLLIKPAANVYAFSHISFQDYFAAEFIVATRQELKFLKENCTNPRKQDIIVFSACMVEDASELVKDMLDLSDLQGKQNYPTIARRLTVATLLLNTVASGAPIPHKIRVQSTDRIIKYVKLATDLFHTTGLNLYCTFVNSEIKVRYTFFKERPTATDAILALDKFISEIVRCGYHPIYDGIKNALGGPLNYSCRALLAACLVNTDLTESLSNYKKICDTRKLPPQYKQYIKDVASEMEKELSKSIIMYSSPK